MKRRNTRVVLVPTARITSGAAVALAILVLGGCGPGGSGYGCTGRTCKATFDGAAWLDMSDQLGKGATVKVSDIRASSVLVRGGEASAVAVRGRPLQLGRLRITLQQVNGHRVTLRVVSSG